MATAMATPQYDRPPMPPGRENDYELSDVCLHLGSFWTVDDGNWKLAEGSVRTKITPGTYQFVVHRSFASMDIMLREMVCHTDKLAEIPGSLAEKIAREVDKFWQSRRRYELMGTVHKRGLMLEGVPGSGKTAICLLLGNEIAKRGGISIFTMPGTYISPLPGVLRSIRDVQHDMPIVNIIEDIDTQMGAIDTLLPMFDGEMQIDNVLHLATTNYLEKLDARLVNRPSRFDKVFKAGAPTKRTRRAYLQKLMERPMAEADPAHRLSASVLNEMVEEGYDLQFAHLKELAHSVYALGEKVKPSGDRLRALAENCKKSGFNRVKEEDDDENEY